MQGLTVYGLVFDCLGSAIFGYQVIQITFINNKVWKMIPRFYSLLSFFTNTLNMKVINAIFINIDPLNQNCFGLRFNSLMVNAILQSMVSNCFIFDLGENHYIGEITQTKL